MSLQQEESLSPIQSAHAKINITQEREPLAGARRSRGGGAAFPPPPNNSQLSWSALAESCCRVWCQRTLIRCSSEDKRVRSNTQLREGATRRRHLLTADTTLLHPRLFGEGTLR